MAITNDNILMKRDDETIDAFLYRLGSLKEDGVLNYTWPQLAMLMNSETMSRQYDESYWRKRYRALAEDNAAANYNTASTVSKDNDMTKNTEFTNNQKEEFEADKTIVRLRDERYALNRIVRASARGDALLDLFREEIRKYDKPVMSKKSDSDDSPKAIYALLSDIHYGIAYSTSAGKYNSDIARRRIMDYAHKIVEIGNKENASDCYVSLLGDMISGNIHTPIRIENRENVVEQVVGVSECVADFLYVLAKNFSNVYVNTVSGNHSRIDMIADNALRAEKLDALIPWYCKTKLDNFDNVHFIDNDIDATVCSFVIYDKYYVGVHGDYDKDLAQSATRIERLVGANIDYMIAGHLHTPNLLLNDRGYIRNGSVCGSGDDFTMRNRLFGNPCQICMVCSENGVESLHPINLK